MARKLNDAIIGAGQAYGGHSGALNLANGGMFGLMPRIGHIGPDGFNYAEFISNHAYVRKNVIPVVLSYPKVFDLFPNPEVFIAAWKALLELHPRSIEGLDSTLTVETDEHPVGGAGEMQEEITNVTRARTQLSMNVKEKAGKAITKFMEFVVRYGYLDPDQKRPLVSRWLTADKLDELGGMYTPEFYTGSVIYIEPDVTCRKVVDAWLCTNVFFKNKIGDRSGKREITAANEIPDINIELASITMNNENVLRLADKILANLSIFNTISDLDMHLPIAGINSSIEAVEYTGFNATQKHGTITDSPESEVGVGTPKN